MSAFDVASMSTRDFLTLKSINRAEEELHRLETVGPMWNHGMGDRISVDCIGVVRRVIRIVAQLRGIDEIELTAIEDGGLFCMMEYDGQGVVIQVWPDCRVDLALEINDEVVDSKEGLLVTQAETVLSSWLIKPCSSVSSSSALTMFAVNDVSVVDLFPRQEMIARSQFSMPSARQPTAKRFATTSDSIAPIIGVTLQSTGHSIRAFSQMEAKSFKTQKRMVIRATN